MVALVELYCLFVCWGGISGVSEFRDHYWKGPGTLWDEGTFAQRSAK